MVAQAVYAPKVVLGKLFIKQAYQDQVSGAFAAGPVIKTAARQAQGLTADGHRTPGRVRGGDQGPLLGRTHRDSVFLAARFSSTAGQWRRGAASRRVPAQQPQAPRQRSGRLVRTSAAFNACLGGDQ